MKITFNGIELAQASCRISHKTKWFARLPVEWIDWKYNSHMIAGGSLNRATYLLGVLSQEDYDS